MLCSSIALFDIEPKYTMRNLTFLRSFSYTMMLTGFIAVLVGYTSSVAIILQALEVLGLSNTQMGGWLMMLGIGMGITTIALSVYYKMPILTAWSTPGIALLATSLSETPINEAIGVFIFASALMLICGLTGIFSKLISLIPRSIASAMLAGILLQFGLRLFDALEMNLILSITMLITYLFSRRYFPLYAMIIVLIIGIITISLQGKLQFTPIEAPFVAPSFIMPQFSITSLISVGIPFFIVSLVSQNAPAIAILQANDYSPKISSLLIWTSIAAIILAPFGGFSICIAAITAPICLHPDVNPNPEKRYIALIWAGVFYLIAGLLGGVIFILFDGLPTAFIQLLAGLALLTILTNSLYQSLKNDSDRDAAMICFLFTASGITLLGIGSAFWGLLGGIMAYHILSKRQKDKSK